jgi:hypothetical protein
MEKNKSVLEFARRSLKFTNAIKFFIILVVLHFVMAFFFAIYRADLESTEDFRKLIFGFLLLVPLVSYTLYSIANVFHLYTYKALGLRVSNLSSVLGVFIGLIAGGVFIAQMADPNILPKINTHGFHLDTLHIKFVLLTYASLAVYVVSVFILHFSEIEDRRSTQGAEKVKIDKVKKDTKELLGLSNNG